MKLEETIQREIMEQRIEAGLEDLSQRLFGKTLEETTDEETYVVLLSLVKGMERATIPNDGDKKIYYISAEFPSLSVTARNFSNSQPS